MKAAAESKLLAALEEVEAKREEAQRQLVLSSPKIQAAVDYTRELKRTSGGQDVRDAQAARQHHWRDQHRPQQVT